MDTTNSMKMTSCFGNCCSYCNIIFLWQKIGEGIFSLLGVRNFCNITAVNYLIFVIIHKYKWVYLEFCLKWSPAVPKCRQKQLTLQTVISLVGSNSESITFQAFFANLQKAIISFVMHVSLSACSLSIPLLAHMGQFHCTDI